MFAHEGGWQAHMRGGAAVTACPWQSLQPFQRKEAAQSKLSKAYDLTEPDSRKSTRDCGCRIARVCVANGY